jgi:TIGR00299 family protein
VSKLVPNLQAKECVMMKTLIFDPFSGAAGDMILGSLIDLGADAGKVCTAIESAVEVSVTVSPVSKKGIKSLDVRVQVPHRPHSRSYPELLEIINKASLPGKVREDALGVFALLAEAESTVHGESLQELHFHKVGQDDALADVIGSCFAMNELAPASVLSTPINVGGGQIHAAHGVFPAPAPATLEILKRSGLPFYGDGKRELLTPTGAALLSHFAAPVRNLPLGRALATGYGAGDAETDRPNVLRALLMELQEEPWGDRVDILETNVDDVSGEILGNLFDRLMGLGARDVSIIPLTMKKGRPGHLVRIVTFPENSSTLAREIMRETGTLGIRVLPAVHRFTAERSIRTVTLSIGNETAEIPVKIACDQEGAIMKLSAEYEDSRVFAERTGLPLQEILRRAQEEAWRTFGTPALS